MDTVGLVTFMRTYARRLDAKDPKSDVESWSQTVRRVVDACNTQLHVGFSKKEKVRFYQMLYNLKCSVAGRFLWQLGTGTVERHGILSLQNCAFITVDEPVYPFTWTFQLLMLGCGVGFNLSKEHVSKLPPLKVVKMPIKRQDGTDAEYIVPDTRQGWVKLLGKVMKAFFYSGKGFTYSLHCIRSKGAPIKTFGGVSSGPDVLEKGIEKIVKVLQTRSGCEDSHMRPIDVLDVMNLIGQIVVSGNIRRSAMIALGDATDSLYMNAKRWDLGNIPNWRSCSNNSVVCNDIDTLPDSFWEGYKGNGEPYGLFNAKLSRSCGRLGETQYPDPNIKGVNPCAEMCLESGETCCLAEIFLPNIQNADELLQVATMLYRVCKHSLSLPSSYSRTTQVVHKNMRMGIGVTGYLMASEQQKSWLKDVYVFLRGYDRLYSAKHQWPRSIKLTTCKPSGTLSLLAGVTPGVHPGFAHYYIRRIRFAANSPLIPLLKKHGYPMEYQLKFDGSNDTNTMVVSFPYKLPKQTIVAKQCTAIQQLEYVKRMQTEWSDNSVSVTVYYRKEELPTIRAWLKKHYNNSVKSVSFLLHSEHGFKQAPYEEITEAAYETLAAKVKPVSMSEHVMHNPDDDEFIEDNECTTGSCPVR